MSVLVSFVGEYDPYFGRSGTKPGPILTLLEQRRYAMIYLLSTPGSNAQTRATREAIAALHAESRIVLVSTGLEDQKDFAVIRDVLLDKLEIMRRRHGGESCSGFITPGTQQMQAAWLSLAERLRPWLGLIEVRMPDHISAAPPEVRDITPEKRPVAGRMADATERMADATGSAIISSLDLGDRVHAMRPLPPMEMKQQRASPPDRVEADAAMDSDIDISFEAATPSTAPDYLAIATEVGIIGEEPCVREMLYTAFRYAQRAIPVLITGETGTGKDLLARYIQRLSPRSERPFVTMNCAAITATLAESELFGVKKGAYTGADRDRVGKFGAADGGTVFLDEIGDLPLEIQATLLRALENHEIQRVGDSRTQHVDVRVIAATNADLHQRVRDGRFRDDLLSRLSVGTIHVPPLRERRGDIPRVAQHLLGVVNRNEGVHKTFTPEALQLLTTSAWERWNIRELRTAIERAWTMAEGEEIDHHHFKMLDARTSTVDAFPLPPLHSGFRWQEFLDELRDRVFTRALEMGGGSPSAAARLLGISPQAVSQFQQNQELTARRESAP